MQGRVIFALMLRETKTIYGSSRLGYGMVLIQNSIALIVLCGLHVVLHRHPFSGGLSVPLFYLCGYMLWLCFSQPVNKCMRAVQGNKALLYFSRVQPMDLILARSILLTATNFMVLIIFCFVLFCSGSDMTIYNLGPIIISVILAASLGMGVGTICCGLIKYATGLDVFIGHILRILLFTSGIFFEVSSVPAAARSWLLYNPLVHLVDYSRTTFAPAYPADYVDLGYVVVILVVVLFLGLLVERYTRHKDTVI